MKLNKKGYMLVEIIVSFVLALSIAMYLLNLTIKFKDTNEDIYYSAKYLKDKNLIMRNISNDLERGIISNINVESAKALTFEISMLNGAGEEVIEQRRLTIDNHTITYGKYNSAFETSNKSYYTKKFESSLIIGSLENCSNLDNGYFCVKIPITSMYDDNNYDIKLFSNNAQKDIEIVVPEETPEEIPEEIPVIPEYFINENFDDASLDSNITYTTTGSTRNGDSYKFTISDGKFESETHDTGDWPWSHTTIDVYGYINFTPQYNSILTFNYGSEVYLSSSVDTIITLTGSDGSNISIEDSSSGTVSGSPSINLTAGVSYTLNLHLIFPSFHDTTYMWIDNFVIKNKQ